MASVIWAGWIYAPVAAWGAVCVTYLVWVWHGIGHMNAKQTARHATRDDPGHTVMDVMLVGVAIASLIDVVGVLAISRGLPAAARTLHAVGAVVSVALSWAVIHTLFTLRYARLYHQAGRGLDFNQDRGPDYRDFAYFAFTVGMTYQTSDTVVTSRPIRRELLRHALLSYLFGTLVLAAAVNVLVGLVP
ncbi:MAG: DUF1345 domain-containing protein [Bifidobacteriaceae bacterium]|nr:DUF1345 domain-containing protein [Bifidobacteriaceae bacterium]